MSSDEQISINTNPVSLREFMAKLKKLAKEQKWTEYKKLVKERKEWFESRGMNNSF